MLSIKDNLEETLKGGSPDRYVNQWEYMDLVIDPIFATSFVPYFTPVGPEYYKNGWGVTITFPEGAPGSHPVHGPGYTVLEDVTQWENIVKPSPLDLPDEAWKDVEKAAKDIRDKGEKHVSLIMAQGVFERVHYLMGMENAMVSYMIEPEAMHGLIDMITEWEIESITRNMEHTEATLLFHHDDWGTGTNSFLDPEVFREFYYEPYKKIYSHFKEMGGELVVHHSDSYAANLVPTMIDMGIDIWQGAIDANNLQDLAKTYGNKIAYMGGIDDAIVDVPDWTPELVRNYVRAQCDKIGTSSFIPCLTHGLNFSIFPGVFDEITKTIDEVSKEKF